LARPGLAMPELRLVERRGARSRIAVHGAGTFSPCGLIEDPNNRTATDGWEGSLAPFQVCSLR
ncbi:MAG: hypothetical protein ACOCXJ_06810, partial [Planctomycetota bacterium]